MSESKYVSNFLEPDGTIDWIELRDHAGRQLERDPTAPGWAIVMVLTAIHSELFDIDEELYQLLEVMREQTELKKNR